MYAPELGYGFSQDEVSPVIAVKEIAVQGRGSWVVPILLGVVGFWFLSRSRGMRGRW